MFVADPQLPSVSEDIWITKYQTWVLYFQVIIFVEYCIVHYAYRQKQKLKKEAARRDGVDMEAVARSVAEVQERAKRAAAEAKAREIEAAREAYRRM